MRLRHALIAALALVLTTGCGLLNPALLGAGAPPQAPAQVTHLSRTALDFSLNSFDAALSGLDFAMDAHMLVPGSEQARNLARIGRQVMNFLGAADSAISLGSSATYEAAFTSAKSALDQFLAAMPHSAHPAALRTGPPPHLTPAERARILARLETPPIT